MNKTLRNRALKDAVKLITVDMNGEDWACPDGFFATAYPIYEGYRVKKDQRVHDQKPDLAKILPTGDYALAETVERIEIEGGYNQVKITSTATERAYLVNADYWDLLTNIYPNALPFVITTGDRFAPVELHDNGTLIAVIMPLKG